MEYISKTTHDGRNVRVKDYKKRVRRNRRRRKVLFVSFLLLCVMIFVHLSPLFNVKEVICTGNNKVSSEELVSTSTISIGYNIFRTSVKKAERNVRKIPYIKEARVIRRLPNKIEIKVTESGVCGYLPLAEGYIYIDENCKMLQYSESPPEEQVPVVQNTGILSFEGGKIVTADDDKKTELLTACYKAIIADNALEKITIIDVAQADTLTLFYNNSLEILVGNIKNIDYKISFALRTINEKLGINPKGFLDIRNPENGTIYREKK